MSTLANDPNLQGFIDQGIIPPPPTIPGDWNWNGSHWVTAEGGVSATDYFGNTQTYNGTIWTYYNARTGVTTTGTDVNELFNLQMAEAIALGVRDKDGKWIGTPGMFGVGPNGEQIPPPPPPPPQTGPTPTDPNLYVKPQPFGYAPGANPWANQGTGAVTMDYTGEAPPAPTWLPSYVPNLTAGQTITKERSLLPSGQFWNKTPWTKQQMLGGYLAYASPYGYPTLNDLMGQIQANAPHRYDASQWRPIGY